MNKKGFTLVELIAVITIVALLSVIAITASAGMSANAKQKVYDEKIKSIETAAALWGQDNPNLFSLDNCTVNGFTYKPSNQDVTEYTCYTALTVQYLANNNYIKPDTEEMTVVDPRDTSSTINHNKVIVYHYYNNYYAEYIPLTTSNEGAITNTNIIINNGEIITHSRDVTVELTAYNANEYCISTNNSVCTSNWTLMSDKALVNYELTDGSGLKTLYALFRNNTQTKVASTTITLELIDIPTFLVDTTSTTATKNIKNKITVISNYLDSTNVYQYYLSTSNTSLTGGSWTNYTSGNEFTMGTNLNGTYYLYIKQIKDITGNLSSINNVTINSVVYHRFGPYIFDNNSVAISYLRINNATTSASSVTSSSIKLYISGTGSPTQMCFSNTPSSSSCTWKTYSTTAQDWNLTTGEGTKTVYAWLKDNAGDISTSIATKTIMYSATDPNCFAYDSTSTSITDYYCYPGNIKKLTKITDLVIPGEINGIALKTIGERAFYDNNLTSVIIPDSVTTIEERAFSSYLNSSSANKLTSVTIGNSVTTIGNEAFARNQLTSVIIPDSVTTIGSSAFTRNQLTSVTIGNNVETIGDTAFYYNKITSVTIPNSVTSIEKNAFAYNQLTSIIIPNSITTIGSNAFAYNQLTSVIIPDSVTSIGDWAFGRNQLTSVTIPNSVKTIGGLAFYYNKLTSVTIPNSVTSIGRNAFAHNQLISVTIPNSVTSIGQGTFQSNQLRSVTIPDSVTSIGTAAFHNNQLTSADYPGGIEIGGGVFNGNPLKLDDPIMYYKNKDGTYDKTILIGYINDGTSSVIIPDTVKTIKDYSFFSENLKSVTIGNNVETIGNEAFEFNNLTSVTIPNSVTSLGWSAFSYNQLTSVKIGSGVKTIGSYAFGDNQLTSVTIPNSVITIENQAFMNNQLKSVTIGSGVTTIEEDAFYKSTTDNSNPKLSLIKIDKKSGSISGSPWGATGATIRYLR